ncbi:MAG TPA: DUF2339 domain-containing protein [Rhizomicrobium sp.]|nr:DUF2339 domain-containing protein [Rhizomicrobium sp.]
MEWLYLAAVVLAFPVMAVVALVKAQNNAREVERLSSALNGVQNQLRLLSEKLRAFESAGAVPDSPVEAAPARSAPPAGVVHEPIAPSLRSFAPASEPKSAPSLKPQNLEESLTSRWFVWLGAIAVALAGTFLVKYTIDEGYLGPAARCTLGFLLGVALIAGGEWLRRRPLQQAIAAVRTDYVPPALTASGLFTAFASIYAAYALYALLSPLAALLALAAVALLAVGLSLLQGMFVALLGGLGGFVTPALIVTPHPDAWGLFGYLAVIEAASLAVARYKGWWWLALATLAGTATWPVLWMLGGWHAGDEYPLGAFLIFSATGFALVRRGWESTDTGSAWLDAFRTLPQPERVVWLAGAVIALLTLAAANAANFSVPALVLTGIVAVLYMLMGRRDAIFDGLPVLMALAVVAIAAAMPLPDAVKLSTAPHAPLIPPSLDTYITAMAAFGALFGVGGFALLWRARRPAIWAAVGAGVPVALLAIAYWRIVDLQVDFSWAAIAIVLAAVSLVAAERAARHRDARGMTDALGFYAAGVIAFLSLAATMSLREAWLTVALSIQLPLLALVYRRVAVRPLEILIALVAGAVLVRLAFNVDILSYRLSGVLGWVLYGYGLPTVCFAGAAWILRRRAPAALLMLLDAGALAFFVLLVSLEIRTAMLGSLAVPQYRLPEESLQAIAWLAIGTVLTLYNQRKPNRVALVGSRLLVALAAIQVFVLQLVAANPIFTHEFIGNLLLLDILFLAYAVPAAFAFVLSVLYQRDHETLLARIAGIAGFVLLFAYLTLEVRHAFQGPTLWELNRSDAESYTYSVVWLVYAVALLALGIAFTQAFLRYAALAILVIVVLKVFLLDMSGLTGLYRVASFLGLGLSLVGIGLVYQRFVFPAPAKPAA